MITSEKTAGQWIRAIKPGQLKSGLFVKADDVVQLGEGDVFTDTWMEKHEAPKPVEAEKVDVEAEQAKAIREHEAADKLRRGKYSVRSVPRSPEGKAEHDKAVKEEARRNAPAIDRGSTGAKAHETSANPSRIDENAKRK